MKSTPLASVSAFFCLACHVALFIDAATHSCASLPAHAAAFAHAELVGFFSRSVRTSASLHHIAAMSKSNASIELSPQAYSVLFMHCCKHPHRTVNGILLGAAPGADCAVVAQEALPLFHSHLALAPMLEAALLMADELCKVKGLQIVGYYQANELCDDLDIGPFGKKIFEKIRGQCPAAACLLLDGAKMRPAPDDLRLLALDAVGKRYGVTPTLAPDAEAAIAKLEENLAKGKQQDIVDFDAHLDDCNKDWTGNSQLLA